MTNEKTKTKEFMSLHDPVLHAQALAYIKAVNGDFTKLPGYASMKKVAQRHANQWGDDQIIYVTSEGICVKQHKKFAMPGLAVIETVKPEERSPKSRKNQERL